MKAVKIIKGSTAQIIFATDLIQKIINNLEANAKNIEHHVTIGTANYDLKGADYLRIMIDKIIEKANEGNAAIIIHSYKHELNDDDFLEMLSQLQSPVELILLIQQKAAYARSKGINLMIYLNKILGVE